MNIILYETLLYLKSFKDSNELAALKADETTGNNGWRRFSLFNKVMITYKYYVDEVYVDLPDESYSNINHVYNLSTKCCKHYR